MQRLTGLDSLFLSLESPTNMFQVGAVTVLDPSTAPAGTPPPYEALRQVIAERLHLLPPFRRRLATVPGGLDHPCWVEDEPDLDWHVRRGALPSPGGPAELAQYAAEVMGHPLDKSRPLWELHVVEGVDGGLVAGVAKIHHAAIDGATGAEVTALLMDLTPETARFEPPPRTGPLDEVPGPARLIAQSAGRAVRRTPATAAALVHAATAGARLYRRYRRTDATAPPAPFSGPRTSLSARLGRHRVVGMAAVSRRDIDDVRTATGTTFNDVVLALAGAALRAQLDDNGELLDVPLTAFVPVSVRTEADALDTGVNRLSGMLVSLATDVDDPVKRLMAVSESAREAKAQQAMLGPDMFGTMAELAVPSLFRPAARLVLSSGATTRWPPFSVVVSSFPGADFPLYCAGGQMLGYHPFGPVYDGAALNITAMTYRDQVGFGLIACRDAVPDIASLARRIPDAMGELAKAA